MDFIKAFVYGHFTLTFFKLFSFEPKMLYGNIVDAKACYTNRSCVLLATFFQSTQRLKLLTRLHNSGTFFQTAIKLGLARPQLVYERIRSSGGSGLSQSLAGQTFGQSPTAPFFY